MEMLRICRLAVCSICMLAWAAHADPFTIGGTTYAAVGPTEGLTAPFTLVAGAATTGTYYGLIQVEVSGTGYSFGPRLNDAFYVYTGGPVANDGSYYQLRYDDAPMATLDATKNAKLSLVYDIDAAAEVTPPYVPAYQASHTYRFVLNTGNAGPTTLWFGVSDGNFADNGGAYNLQITQLAPVPEPCTLALLGVGALVLAVRRRRLRA
jgi:hypothetical protein